MLNSEFINQRAAIFAGKLESQYPELTDQQLRHGFELATGRTPTEAELTELNTLHEDLLTDYKLDPSAALARICLLLLNLNGTLYLD